MRVWNYRCFKQGIHTSQPAGIDMDMNLRVKNQKPKTKRQEGRGVATRAGRSGWKAASVCVVAWGLHGPGTGQEKERTGQE